MIFTGKYENGKMRLADGTEVPYTGAGMYQDREYMVLMNKSLDEALAVYPLSGLHCCWKTYIKLDGTSSRDGVYLCDSAEDIDAATLIDMEIPVEVFGFFKECIYPYYTNGRYFARGDVQEHRQVGVLTQPVQWALITCKEGSFYFESAPDKKYFQSSMEPGKYLLGLAGDEVFEEGVEYKLSLARTISLDALTYSSAAAFKLPEIWVQVNLGSEATSTLYPPVAKLTKDSTGLAWYKFMDGKPVEEEPFDSHCISFTRGESVADYIYGDTAQIVTCVPMKEIMYEVQSPAFLSAPIWGTDVKGGLLFNEVLPFSKEEG